MSNDSTARHSNADGPRAGCHLRAGARRISGHLIALGPAFPRHGYVFLFLFGRGAGLSAQEGANSFDVMPLGSGQPRVPVFFACAANDRAPSVWERDVLALLHDYLRK